MSGRYRTIVADPPWPGHWFPKNTGAGIRRESPSGYGLMTMDEIDALPIAVLSADSAHLFLWVPARLNREGVGVHVIRAWGFDPISEFVWEKPNLGMGRFPRVCHELLLVGRRGDLAFTAPLNIRSVQRWRQRYDHPQGGKRHSSKPDGAIDLIEQVSPGPYVELFARRQRLGWDTWGNQAFNTANFEVPA